MRPLFLDSFNFLLKRALPLSNQVIYSINTKYFLDSYLSTYKKTLHRPPLLTKERKQKKKLMYPKIFTAKSILF